MKFGLSFALILALSTASQANVEGFLKDSVYVSGSGPSYTSSQTRGVFSLGEMRVATNDIGTIGLPIKFTAPKISAGCGGIDATLGGFQFLLDEMVEKFKKIAAAAPAFAFQIALNFLCPECAQMMAQLEALANKLNSMGIDGCNAMQGLADWTSNKLQDTQAFKAIHGSADGPWSKQVTKWASSSTETLNSLQEGVDKYISDLSSKGASSSVANDAAKNMIWQGSLISKTLKEHPEMKTLIGSDKESEEIMRAITGDIIRFKGSIAPSVVAPMFSAADIDALMEGGGKKVHGIQITLDSNDYVTEGPKETEITITKGMKKHFEEQLLSILTKMTTSINTNTPSALSPAELNFINAMPLPIYKMLNTEAQKGMASLDPESVKQLASTLASIQAHKLLGDMMGKIYFSIMSYANKNADYIDVAQGEMPGMNVVTTTIQQNIKDMRTLLQGKLKANQDMFQQKLEVLNYYSKLDQQIGAKLASNGIFSRKQLVGW